MTPPTPAEAAVSSFVTGCVARGITASVAVAPSPGQFEAARGLWADVARDVVAATPLYAELARQLAEAVADRDDYAARLRAVDQGWAKLAAERDQLREVLQWLADDGNLEARDRLAAITRAGET